MALPHSGIPVPDPAPQDATVDDLTAATLTVTGASTLASVSATALTTPAATITTLTTTLAGELGGTPGAATVNALHGGSTHTATQAAAEATAAAALAAHEADTTAIHGIADTSALATGTDVSTAVAAHTGDAVAAHAASAVSFSPTGTVAAADAQSAIAEVATDAAGALAAHEADTTSIHGITDTSLLATKPTYSAWTPSLTATSVNPTLGTGSSAQGRYFQSGQHVVAYGSINFGTAGTAAGTGDYNISLPVTARTRVNNDMNMIGQGYLFDSSASALRPCIFIYVTTGTVAIRLTSDGSLVGAAAPWAWSASDVLIFHFDYEAA